MIHWRISALSKLRFDNSDFPACQNVKQSIWQVYSIDYRKEISCKWNLPSKKRNKQGDIVPIRHECQYVCLGTQLSNSCQSGMNFIWLTVWSPWISATAYSWRYWKLLETEPMEERWTAKMFLDWMWLCCWNPSQRKGFWKCYRSQR